MPASATGPAITVRVLPRLDERLQTAEVMVIQVTGRCLQYVTVDLSVPHVLLERVVVCTHQTSSASMPSFSQTASSNPCSRSSISRTVLPSSKMICRYGVKLGVGVAGVKERGIVSDVAVAELGGRGGRVVGADQLVRLGLVVVVASTHQFTPMNSRQTTGTVLEVSGGETLVDRLD